MSRIASWSFSKRQGYTIQFAADTASREAGKDIVAERDGRPLVGDGERVIPKGTP
jgi:hypothetical protein